MYDDNKYNNVERNSLKFPPIKIIDNLLICYHENNYLLNIIMQILYTCYKLISLNIKYFLNI